MKPHVKIDGLDIAIVHPIYGGTERKGTKIEYEEPEGTFGKEIVTFGFGPKTRNRLAVFRQKVRNLCEEFGTPDRYVGGNYFVPTRKLDELLAKEDELRQEYRVILDAAEDVEPELKDRMADWGFFFHVTFFGLTKSIERRAEKLIAESIEESIKTMEKRLGEVQTSSDRVKDKYHARIDNAMELAESPVIQAKLGALRALVESKTEKEAERAANVVNKLVEGGRKLYDQVVEAQASGWVSDEFVTALQEYQRKADEIGAKFGAGKDPRMAELVANIRSVAGAKP